MKGGIIIYNPNNFEISMTYIGGIQGVKIAKIKGGSVKAFYTSKNNIHKITDYINNKSGIYLLMNSSNIYANNFSIYVGQSSRLNQRVIAPHNNKNRKEIKWKYSLLFINESSPLSTDDILCLEQEIYSILKSKNFNLLNGNPPKGTNNLSNDNIEQLNMDSLGDIKKLSSTLGLSLFYINDNQINNAKKNQIPYDNYVPDYYYHLKRRQGEGWGYIKGDSFVILKGSTVSPLNSTTYYVEPKINGKRMDINSMIQAGILNNKLTFIKNCAFTSKTKAADFIIQSHINGKDAWK